jgi:uridine phosphorylase
MPFGKKTDAPRQYHIGLKEGEVGKYVLLPGDPGRVERIARYFDESRKVAENREFTTFTGYVDTIKLSVTSTGIGCPSAAIAIEELARVGATTFIRVGTAGSLQKNVGVGDLVISTGAVRDEGTTVQYVPLPYPAVADLDVTHALRSAAIKLGFPAHTGITHCKDSFYSETDESIPLAAQLRERWNVWMKANVLATSMESAVLFVISSFRKLRAGEVLAIIGLTHKDQPVVAKAGINEAIRVAIEAVKILDSPEPQRHGRS